MNSTADQRRRRENNDANWLEDAAPFCWPFTEDELAGYSKSMRERLVSMTLPPVFTPTELDDPERPSNRYIEKVEARKIITRRMVQAKPPTRNEQRQQTPVRQYWYTPNGYEQV